MACGQAVGRLRPWMHRSWSGDWKTVAVGSWSGSWKTVAKDLWLVVWWMAIDGKSRGQETGKD